MSNERYLIVLYSSNKIIPTVYSIKLCKEDVDKFISENKLKRMIPYYYTADVDKVIEMISEQFNLEDEEDEDDEDDEDEETKEELINRLLNEPYESFEIDNNEYICMNRYEITDESYFRDETDFEIQWHFKNVYTTDRSIAIFEMEDYDVRDIMKHCTHLYAY